ncbi:hypothetical protein GCM10011452_30440 [Gemmobacter lanyuensis]|uniref:LysR substrate-binding domain-containing protein n=1 Tax=Gemmobacter lanyuensis TaxID=1054497 RepID=A0A918J1M8_9RHOB|nr:LysR substrate-binding domain-containing protein [Gemmobacter lanyuensis]GGW39948.1 hypothetical protein GCM10011452_30440 [Gemmobacter lanyuensis]
MAIRRDLIEWQLHHGSGASVTVLPKIDFAANRQSILVEAAIAGLGVANLPTFLVDAACQSGSLVRLFPDWEPTPIEMTALWQRDRITERLVKAIVAEFVVAFD